MSSRDPRRKGHHHHSRDGSSPVAPSSRSSRRHRLEGNNSPQRKSEKEHSRRASPHHATSNKRSRRSPSPSKPKTSKRHKEDASQRHKIPNDISTHSTDTSSEGPQRTLLLKQMLDEKKLHRQAELSTPDDDTVTAEPIEDASAWVLHSRSLEQKRKEKETTVEKRGQASEDRYLSQELKGMKVGHSLDGFMEGEYTVLTLKDMEVLDDEAEETLQNPTMLDHDRASRNREMKGMIRGGGRYDPYEDTPGQEEGLEKALKGVTSTSNLLSKYDDEISGVKTRSFHLSTDGQLDMNSCSQVATSQREELLSQLGKREVDLTMEHRFASQVMTSEEIAEKFRKIKKRRKVVPLRAEELLPNSAPPHPLPGDMGSREQQEKPAPSSEYPPANFRGRKVKSEELVGPAVTESDDNTVQLVSTADEAAISSAKERIRRLRESAFSRRQMDPVERAAAIASQALRISQSPSVDPDKPATEVMIFDSTQEFVRSLNTNTNTNTTSSNSSNIPRRMQGDTQMGSDSEEDMHTGSDGEKDGWKELKNGEELKGRVKNEEDRDHYFDAEPIVSHSLTSALLLAERKGFIEKKSASTGYADAIPNPKDKNDISSRNYSLTDKQTRPGDRDRDRDRDNRGRDRDRDRDRSRGDRDTFGRNDYRDRDSFPDMKSYVPDIKLEYVDDLGRELSQKEAFRRMSHVFHGKGSGKMKTERRIKKAEDELSMMKMNSFDTPLNTVAMATKKMETSGTPYLILSGGQHSLEASSVVTQGGLAKGRK